MTATKEQLIKTIVTYSDEIAALTARVKELEGLLEFAVNNKQNFTEHDSDGVIKWWIEKSAAALRGEA